MKKFVKLFGIIALIAVCGVSLITCEGLMGPDGKGGVDGKDGVAGEKGDKGDAPEITIGGNGNWFINGVDTGIKAQGEDGKDGTGGIDIDQILTVGENGNWFILGIDTGIKAPVVTIAAIPGVTAPVAGQTPVTVITETAQFKGTVEWLPDNDVFQPSTVYTATITLSAKTGYTLHCIEENFFTVTGATAANAESSNIITAVFPQTAATITISEIEGLTPASSNVPVKTISTDQFTGTVAWTPNDANFKHETAYAAAITLTAKAGYTLYGVPENFFTVAGAAQVISNAVNTGEITANFPETGPPATVTISEIELKAPMAIYRPATTITETGQFTGTVTWSPDDVRFVKSKTYTATITLTVKDGVTLTGIPANFFTVEGAQASNTADSGIVTAVFSETKPFNYLDDMVWIEGGTFTMGSNDPEDSYWYTASPAHEVTITNGFYMGKYEVTQALYELVMDYNPSYFQGGSRLPVEGEVQENRPVEYVTWFDAVEFCNKLSELEELEKVYTLTNIVRFDNSIFWADVTADFTKNGYRLPTEAEWEYACRAGTTTAYSYGNMPNDDYMWYYYNSSNRTHEVGKKLPNPWGLYDMHGNVWEWCWDSPRSYNTTPQNDPGLGPVGGYNRAVRGGSWYDDAVYARSAIRYFGSFDGSVVYRNGDLGFRLVRP